MQLKVLSWNIWCDGNIEEVNKFLGNSNADIICLQEVLPSEKINPITYLTNLGYAHAYFDSMEIKHQRKMVFMGNATFSRFKILNQKAHLLSAEKQRIALQTDIKINNELLHIFNIHLTHAHLEESEERNHQMKILINLLPKEKVLVMGDFNALPQSETLEKIESALTNTDPLLTPTWSNYPQGCEGCLPQGLKYRLDYIFASKDIRIVSSKVIKSKASDHLPVLTTIEI